MARTAPVPNIPPIPGMCPSIAALGGGGDGGGGSGKGGKKGKGKDGAGTGDGEEDASGDGKKGGCAAGDPICPITGRMFCEVFDFAFNGPQPLRWMRRYNSRTCDVATNIGFGWSHDFGWSLTAKRSRVIILDDWAREQEMDLPPKTGEWTQTSFGSLRRSAEGGFVLRLQGPPVRDYVFGPDTGKGRHLLLSVVDRHGNAIELKRDERGLLIGLVDSAGRPYRVESDPAGRIIAIAVATNPTHTDWMEVVRYGYDADGNLASATDAEGYVSRYRYDNHLMVEHESVSGLSYFYRYDGRTPEAYCVETWGEYRDRIDPALEHPLPPPPLPPKRDRRKVKGIQHRRMTYVKTERYCESENGLGGLTRYFGDECGRAKKIVNPAGAVTERFYSPETGALIQESNEAATPRQVLRDDAGGPTGFLGADGKAVVMFRQEDGTYVLYDERDSSIIRTRTDERGNLVFIEHADFTREEFEHDDRGLLLMWIDPQGGITRYEHDAQGNATLVAMADGSIEESEFDYLGRRIAHYDGAGNKTEFVWDRRNEPIEKRHADGSVMRVERDAMRKPVAIDEAGRITRLEYGGIGWLTKITRPGGETHEIRYDVEGNLTSMSNDRGQVFRQEYNPSSLCVAYTTWEGARYEMGYDAAANPIYIAGPLGRITFEHDDNQDLVALESPDVGGTFEYGGGGFAALKTEAVNIESKFDTMGRIREQIQGAHRCALAWVGGQLATISSSVGLPVTYERKAMARVAAIIVGNTKVRRGEHSGNDYLSYFGETLVQRQTFSPCGRLLRQSIARYDRNVPAPAAATRDDPGLIYWASYEYDAAQMLRRAWRSDGTQIDYELDGGDRIVTRRVTKGGAVREERLAYDAIGTPRVLGATYDAHGRPLTFRGETFTFDEQGRLARRLTDAGEWVYEWNALDQLVRVTAPNRVIEMDYDLTGRRMRKRVHRQNELVRSVSYVWANHLLLHEVDDQTGASRTYLSENDGWETLGHVDLRDGVEHPCLYVLDPAGTLEFALDASGEVVWDADSTVYGERAVHTAKTDVTLRFANQYWDADVELVYNRYRWYEPRLGLYVSCDPWLLKGTLNPRDYVPNPTGFIDPTGLGTKHQGVGSGEESTKFHPSPNNPVAPHPGGVSGLGAHEMSEPGHWARNIPPGTPGHTPGFANCPPDALHSAGKTGFQQEIPENGGKSAQEIVDKAGGKYGCHTCGAKKSGYPDNADGTPHWTCDHQPPRCTYSKENADKAGNQSSHNKASRNTVRLYPMCSKCSNKQAGAVGGLSAGGAGVAGKIAKGNQQMALNAAGR